MMKIAPDKILTMRDKERAEKLENEVKRLTRGGIMKYERLTRIESDKEWVLDCEKCEHKRECGANGSMDENYQYCIERIGQRLAELEDKIEKGTLIELPCKVGDTVYKICPKCNDKHNGTCENCAWRGCISYDGCSVFGLWDDGQYPPERCTIVPYKMDYRFIPVVLKNIGTKIFLTREEAEKRLKEIQG